MNVDNNDNNDSDEQPPLIPTPNTNTRDDKGRGALFQYYSFQVHTTNNSESLQVL